MMEDNKYGGVSKQKQIIWATLVVLVIFGVGVLRNGIRHPKFMRIVENTVILLFIALVILIIAAVIEVYFTPILFR